MTLLMTAFAELAGLVATILALQFAIVAFRDPFRPSWLRHSTVETLAAVLATAGLGFAGGFAMSGLIEAGLSPLPAMAVAALIGVIAAVVPWRLAHGPERLRRAATGQSPFRRAPRPPAHASPA